MISDNGIIGQASRGELMEDRLESLSIWLPTRGSQRNTHDGNHLDKVAQFVIFDSVEGNGHFIRQGVTPSS